MNALAANPSWPDEESAQAAGQMTARRFGEDELPVCNEDIAAGAEFDRMLSRRIALNQRNFTDFQRRVLQKEMAGQNPEGNIEPVSESPQEQAGELEGQNEMFEPAKVADPTLWLYRDRTAALVRRYFRFSIEVGRLPSLLGREFFRTRVTTYRVGTFEDAVIFVRDVERCLEQLDDAEIILLSKIVFEDFTHVQAAEWVQSQRRTVGRRLPEVLDHLSEILLENGILTRLAGQFPKRENTCQ